MDARLRSAIIETSSSLGISPVDLATAMSYETGGTFDPWQKGPTTKWGTHRGLIQWGVPQRKRYGVYKGMPVEEQVRAVGRYLKDAGVKPGMGLLEVYSAINAGGVGDKYYSRSDAAAGGAPGTVRDKVEKQMGGHRKRATMLLGEVDSLPLPEAPSVSPMPAAVAAAGVPSGTQPGALAFGQPETANTPPEAFNVLLAGGATEQKPVYEMPTRRGQKVLDPALLEQLNAPSPITQGNTRKKVEDPELLKALNADKGGYETQHPELTPPAANEPGAMEKIGAFLTGVADLPVVGPAIKAGQRNIAAAIAAPFSDSSFGEIRDDMAARQDQVTRENPGFALAGNVTGALGTMIPAASTAIGGRILGVAGNSLLGRIGAGAASNALIAGADTAVRGGAASDVLESGAIGGLIGGVVPAAGSGMVAGARAVKDVFGPRINALLRPTQEAERRVGNALQRDAQNSAAPVLTQADETSAALNNQQLLNVDRGGETTRALARSAANADPEARAIIERTASDRFSSQGARAQSFIDRITGGASDDLALQEQLKQAARATNKPAYDKAYEEGAKGIWTPEMERLASSPAFTKAMRAAAETGKDRAVVDGFGGFNPRVKFTPDGQMQFTKGPSGVATYPDLQYWDYVKRELDDMAGAAVRSGRKQEAATLTSMASALRNELDAAVPSYKAARQGAAAFFGAEDALEAGKKFVTQNRTVPEVRKALDSMSKPERATFAVGFAAELKDMIAQSGDRTNVINKIFGSEQARAKIKLALGPRAFSEFEQFVKVEHTMDMLRGAMGNSTTARQLAELGLAGGAGIGTTALTGDWKSGLTAAILTGLARRGGQKIDERITKRVAELLLADDPQKLKQAVILATNSPRAAKAVEAIRGGMIAGMAAIGQVSTRPAQ